MIVVVIFAGSGGWKGDRTVLSLVSFGLPYACIFVQVSS